jgi:hypothetical protein
MLAIQSEELLKPETILPAQFQRIWCGTRTTSPERALHLAVLRQALEDLRNHQDRRGAQARRLYREAYQWVASDERRWPCSFLNVCDVLGLCAGALRAELLRREPEAA